MKLLVLGATRGIGAKVVDHALAEGHEVRGFARSVGDKPDRPGLTWVAGDATKAEDLAPALEGVDAVIFAIGLGGDFRRFLSPTTLFSDATRALLPAMAGAGVRRLVAVTGFGAGDSARAMSFIERTGHRAILGRAYADKDRQEEMIRAADLDWTLVRPTILTDSAATGRYKVLADPVTWRNGMIGRADVAAYCVRAAVEGLNLREAVVLTR